MRKRRSGHRDGNQFRLIRYYADGLGLPGTSSRTMPVEWELFDLDIDPHELRSVYDDPAYAACGRP